MKTQRVQWTLMVLALLLSQLSLWTTSFAQGRPDIVWMAGGHAGSVYSVAFSPDGQYLASGGGWDGTIKLWRVSDGALVRTWHMAVVNSVAFSPDGHYLASGGGYLEGGFLPRGEIKLWRVSDGALVRTLTGHTHYVYSVAFSPDGQYLASGSRDTTIKVWRVSDGALIRTLTGHAWGVESVAFSPDGQYLASGGGYSDGSYVRGEIKLWRVSDGALVRTLTGHTYDVSSVAFSPDGQYLASGSLDRTIKLWRVSDGALVRTLTGHTSAVYSVSFSPDGQYLASGSGDNTIKIWRVSDGALVRTLTGHTDWVFSVAFSPDGQYLASGSRDYTIKLWRVSDGALVRTLYTGWVYSVAFSPDGQYLASGGRDYTVKVWRVSDGALIHTLRAVWYVYSVAFSPDGQLLASGSWNEIKIWRVSDGALLGAFTGYWDAVNSVAFSPDGRLLASGSDDTIIRLWRMSDGALVRTLTGHTDWVYSVAFSPDGQYLASGSRDATLKLWRVSDGALVRYYDQETSIAGGGVLSVQFSPNGRFFGYGRWDATVVLARNSFYVRSPQPPSQGSPNNAGTPTIARNVAWEPLVEVSPRPSGWDSNRKRLVAGRKRNGVLYLAFSNYATASDVLNIRNEGGRVTVELNENSVYWIRANTVQVRLLSSSDGLAIPPRVVLRLGSSTNVCNIGSASCSISIDSRGVINFGNVDEFYAICLRVYLSEPGQRVPQNLGDVKDYLRNVGGNHRIPPHLLWAIAWEETLPNWHWSHTRWDGWSLLTFDGGIGLMQLTGGTAVWGPREIGDGWLSRDTIPSDLLSHLYRLASDWQYNARAGAAVLSLPTGRVIGPSYEEPPWTHWCVLEHWWFRVWAYNGISCGNNSDRCGMGPYTYPERIRFWLTENCPSDRLPLEQDEQIERMGIPSFMQYGTCNANISRSPTPYPANIDVNFDGVIDATIRGSGQNQDNLWDNNNNLHFWVDGTSVQRVRVLDMNGNESYSRDGSGEVVCCQNLEEGLIEVTLQDQTIRTRFSRTGALWQMPGDVDGDGCVDDADLLAVLFAFGSSGTGLPEDVNGDGVVDDADLLMVLFNFGSGC